MAQINHAIGAAGVVSQECKAVVAQYGETILQILTSKVRFGFDSSSEHIKSFTISMH